MGFFRWLFGKKEYISPRAIEHSSLGDYNTVNRLKGGGHGQEAIDYMRNHGVAYNITRIYDNGVRVGNIPNHTHSKKKRRNMQAWFPKSWDRQKIKRAGQVVARGRIFPDGNAKYGHYDNVNVGIIRTNSKIATIFPASKQRDRRGRARIIVKDSPWGKSKIKNHGKVYRKYNIPKHKNSPRIRYSHLKTH